MRTVRSLTLGWISLLIFAPIQAQVVHKYAGVDSLLDARWTWALSEGARNGQEFWIGYNIKRLMDEDSYLLSGNAFSGSVWNSGVSLYDILAGKISDGTKNPNWHSDDRPHLFKRLKDVAILFLYSNDQSGKNSIQKIDLCSMDLSVDLKAKPSYWLGSMDDDQSVHKLADIFAQISTVDSKKRLVEAIGIHQRSTRVYPFLRALLTSDDLDEIRAKAAFWIGEANQPDALNLFMDVAQNDRSLKVREQAVFAVSRLDSDKSTEALITLARDAKDSKVRAKAVFWLGQKASQQVAATLEIIIADDVDTDVQRQALFALSRIKNKDGVDRLIKIARTHPNPRIRKQAVQLLGQSEDSRALDALIEIVRK